MSSAASVAASAPSSSASNNMNTACIYFYGSKRKISWPCECKSVISLLHTIADACEVRHEAIHAMLFRLTSSKSSASALSSMDLNATYAVSGEEGVLIPIELIIDGNVSEFIVVLNDGNDTRGDISDSSAILNRYYPVALPMLDILSKPADRPVKLHHFASTPSAHAPVAATSIWAMICDAFFASDIGTSTSDTAAAATAQYTSNQYMAIRNTNDDATENVLMNNDAHIKMHNGNNVAIAGKKGDKDVDEHDYFSDDVGEREDDLFDSDYIRPLKEFRGRSYQNQLLKFQRILAHLVNERTVLAWLRVNLSFIIIAIKFMNLAYDYSSAGSSVSSILYMCGGLYVLILPFSWYAGFKRFRRCKEMLDYDLSKIAVYLYKMGFDVDIMAFALLVGVSFLGVIVGGSTIIWTSASASDDSL